MALVLFIRSPWGQGIIVDRVVSYVSGKTKTEVRIDKLYLTFSGNLSLKGLYLEDQKEDTLVYSEKLEVSLALLPLIKGNRVNVKSIEWEGLTARVNRPMNSDKFNYEFLIDAFATPSSPDATVTNSSSMEVAIGMVDFESFDLIYQDNFADMSADLKLGALTLEIDELDFEEMHFGIGEVSFADTKMRYEVFGEKEPSSTGSPSSSDPLALPKISIDDLSINNVQLAYKAGTDLSASLDLGEILLSLAEFDLNKQEVSLRKFSFNKSQVFAEQIAPDKQVTDSTSSSTQGIDFIWPDWNVKAGEISMNDNELELKTTYFEPEPGVFNPEWIKLTDLNLMAKDINYQPEQAGLMLKELSFNERSGFQLKQFGIELNLEKGGIDVTELEISTKQNSVLGELRIDYDSFESFLSEPKAAFIDLDLSQYTIGLGELKTFSPALLENEYLSLLAEKPLSGSLALNGALSKVTFPSISINWGKNMALKLSGDLTDLLDVDQLKVNISQLNAQTTKGELSKVIDPNELGFTLPNVISLSGEAKGSLDDIIANLALKTSSGTILLNGDYNERPSPNFKADVRVKNLLLGELLENQSLDTLSMTTSLSGSGNNFNDLSIRLKTDFSKLTYGDYDFSNLSLSGDIKEGKGDIDLSFIDRNLDMTLATSIELDSIKPKINALLTVKGADLYELGLTTEGIRTAFVLDAAFEGNSSAFKLKSKLREGVAIYQREAFPFGAFDLDAFSISDSLDLSLKSATIDSRIIANGGLEKVIPLIQQQVDGYFQDDEFSEGSGVDGDINVKMDLILRQTPILSEVFLQDLQRVDSIVLKANFNQRERTLNADLKAPYIQYGTSALDSLFFSLKGDKDTLKYALGWSQLESGPVAINQMTLAGDIENGLIRSGFSILEDRKQLVNIDSEVQLTGDTIQVRLNPETLVLNNKSWSVPIQNEISITSTRIDLNAFELSNGVQKITFSTDLPQQSQDHIGAVFEDFELSTFTSFLNTDRPLGAGKLKGDVTLENPFGSYGLVAGLSITELSALEVPLGTLKLDASAVGSDKYDLNLSLNGPSTNLSLTGSYLASSSGADLTLDLDLKDLQMSVLEKLYGENVSKTKGNVSGEVKVSGKVNSPKYNGVLNFNQVSFLVNQLNTEFRLTEEQFKVDNAGLYFDNFMITDGDSNEFSLDGSVSTKELINPSFDLKLKADNFGVVNSTKENSDLFYGQVNMDADLTIQGDLTIPKVRGKLKVVDGSSLTFKVPESQLELKARDGVVLFVNRKNPDDILTRVSQNESSALAASLSGYDIETILSIGDDSQFKIIIDEATGDNLLVKGTGDFNLALEPNGRTSLSGKYELSGGHYEANLYNLVKRRFEIASGSSIAWSGDPYNADLKVSALYNVKTSAGPLMATRTSAEGIGLESTYQERLPFQVFINVDGMLLQPDISFNLDMPDEDRGALGGVVYEQVQQLNSQEEELNKQVFSLLVLNRFFPSSGSDGSNGGPASLALDNVNKVLSGQLNNYSDKLFGNTGFDVGFDLNSSTGNQANGGQTQTQLGITAKRQLFNDRLIVQVGSEVDVAGQSSSQGAPIVGNVSLEYLLTQDRRLRLKGFSKNEYEGIIDGQLTVSGIALIFTREFNKFKELWAKQVKDEVDKSKQDK